MVGQWLWQKAIVLVPSSALATDLVKKILKKSSRYFDEIL